MIRNIFFIIPTFFSLNLIAQEIITLDNQTGYTLCLREFDRAVRKPSDYEWGVSSSCTTMIEPGALVHITDDYKDDGWLFDLYVIPQDNCELYVTSLNQPGIYIFEDLTEENKKALSSNFGLYGWYFSEDNLLSNEAFFQGNLYDANFCKPLERTIKKPYVGFFDRLKKFEQ